MKKWRKNKRWEMAVRKFWEEKKKKKKKKKRGIWLTGKNPRAIEQIVRVQAASPRADCGHWVHSRRRRGAKRQIHRRLPKHGVQVYIGLNTGCSRMGRSAAQTNLEGSWGVNVIDPAAPHSPIIKAHRVVWHGNVDSAVRGTPAVWYHWVLSSKEISEERKRKK